MVEASGTGDAQPGAPERGEFARQLIVITVVALILRLAYVAFIRPHDAVLAPDAFLYHQGANLLADGRGFIDPYVFVNEGIVTPAADHPPVYMLYLAFFSFLGLTSPLAHMVASTFLGAATVVMVGLTGREVGGARVGLVAAALAALLGDLVLVDGSLQSESMAVLAVTTCIYFALRYRHHPSLRTAAGLGVLVGWAGMTRPEQFLLGPGRGAPRDPALGARPSRSSASDRFGRSRVHRDRAPVDRVQLHTIP